MGDDGEKFGAWPTTYEHCWGEGRWVERFFEALEANADWLTTVTPSQWLDREPPIGRVYVPTSSYAEMGEWALPPDETVVFTEAAPRRGRGRSAPTARWLRGGFWRNFQVKYREINDLHKQMLRTSRKVAAMTEGPARTAALDHLHRGQRNDCYWHGLFGGIYICHMRLATYEHLIAAEDAADRAWARSGSRRRATSTWTGSTRSCSPSPGRSSPSSRPRARASAAWDLRAACHALAAVMRRRPEAYHEILRAHEATAIRAPRRRSRGRRRAGLDPRHRDGQGGGPLRPPALRRPRATVRARPLPRPGRHPRGRRATPRTTELGDFRDGAFADRPPRGRPGLPLARGHGARPAARPSPRRSASTAAGCDPSWPIEVEVHHRGDAPIETRLGHGALAAPAGWRRQPLGVVRRRAASARRHDGRARPRASRRSATATTGWAWPSTPG